MKNTDWTDVKEQKDAIRRREAERPFAEKLSQLDRLRDRASAIRDKRSDSSAAMTKTGAAAGVARRKK